jgi:hypothetical protein
MMRSLSATIAIPQGFGPRERLDGEVRKPLRDERLATVPSAHPATTRLPFAEPTVGAGRAE